MPDGSFTTVSYDAEGRQISSTDALGRTSLTEYDALGRAVKHIAPDGTFTTTAYDAAGRMTSSTDARGNSTQYIYDTAGRTLSVTNALNQTTSYTYDDAGRQTHMTDALGRTTDTVYDEMGRPIKTIFADGTFTETGYDAAGRRTSSKDQAGTVSNHEYDAQSRLIAVVNALGHRTEYVYDNFGRQTQQKDALGRVTSYQYDTLSRRIGRTLPMGQQESVAYDAVGQMLSRTDFNNRTTTFGYDVMGRLTTRTPSTAFSEEPAITYTYNAKGQLLTMTDATGTTPYAYDTRDRLTQKVTPQGTLFYTYDIGGSLASITTSTSGGAAMTYTYDALNRLATVTDLNNQTTTYSYDAVGNLATTALPNGVTSTYSYTSLNRLLNLASEKSGNNVANYGYTLAATGHRLFASETLGTITPATRVVSYTYDAIKRLTGESIAANTSPNGATTWTYNEVSNRLTQTSTLPGIPNQTHAYDANDRLTADTHDANGNTLTGTINTSVPSTVNPQPIPGSDAYDSQDRLISRFSPDGSYVQVKFNGEGHRVEQTVFRFDTQTTTITKWLVDNLNPTGYAQVIEEHVSQNASPSALSAVFIYGHDLISQDRRQPNTSQWDLSYYGYDGHGNVRYLTNAAGTITDSYDYDAWGQLLNTTGTTQNPYLYTGEQYDPALGLYHLRARMMNPLTGRFWNMDTYEGHQTDPASLHKYLYANADPVQGIDPSGNFSLVEAFAVPLITRNIRAISIGYVTGIYSGIVKIAYALHYLHPLELELRNIASILGRISASAEALVADQIPKLRSIITGMATGLLYEPVAGALLGLGYTLGSVAYTAYTVKSAITDAEKAVGDAFAKVSKYTRYLPEIHPFHKLRHLPVGIDVREWNLLWRIPLFQVNPARDLRLLTSGLESGMRLDFDGLKQGVRDFAAATETYIELKYE
jgi:RHS repeat-associated protein